MVLGTPLDLQIVFESEIRSENYGSAGGIVTDRIRARKDRVSR